FTSPLRLRCRVSGEKQRPPVAWTSYSPSGTLAKVYAPLASVVAGGIGVFRISTVALFTGLPPVSRTLPETEWWGASARLKSCVVVAPSLTGTLLAVWLA